MAATEFVCPQCKARAASQKEIPAGAMVRCPKCSNVFRYEGPPAATSSPKSAPAEPAKPAAARPAPPATKVTQQRPQPAVAARRARDDDDDYDDRDRGRSRKRRRPEKSGPNMMVIGLIVGSVLIVLVIGGVILAVALSGGSDKNKNVAVLPTNPMPPPQTYRQNDPATSPRPPSNNPTNPSTSTGPKKEDALPEIPVSTGQPNSVKDIHEYVLKSIVLIVNELGGGKAALGTGSVIDANERLILTNYHVIANNSGKLYVFFPEYENGKVISEKAHYMDSLRGGGKKRPEDLVYGEVLAADDKRDLAIVRVPKVPQGTESLPLAKNMPNIGQTVHSFGNAGASDALWIYTQGAVRSIYRKRWRAGGDGLVMNLDAEVVETQSPTNHGDSGGPLVNDRGELVGVTEGGSAEAHLISFFISLTEARDFIEKTYQSKYGKPWAAVARAPMRVRGGGGGADVTQLINLLDHKEAKTRAAAARALGEMGQDGRLGIRKLVKLLNDPDELTGRVAGESLVKIGAPGKDDLAALLPYLKDPKVEIRRYAAGAIGQIGPEAASAASQLVDSIGDTDEQVKEAAVRSLGSLGSGAKSNAVTALINALKDDNKKVAVAAASSLTNLLSPPTVDDVPTFLTIMKHKDPEASVFGARALAKLGKQAKSALPDLLEAAKGGDPGVRKGAIDTIAAIGPDAKTVAPLYVDAIKDGGDPGLRQSALLALGQLGKELDKEKDKDTIAAALGAIKDADPGVKKAAMAAAGKLGPMVGVNGAKIVMPAVIDALTGKDAALVEQAHETIAGLGPLAKDAVNPLIEIMVRHDVKIYINRDTKKIFIQDGDDQFLEKIAKTLGKIGAPAVRLCHGSLQSTNANPGLLIGCCRALGEIGAPAKSALNDLVAISQGPFPPPVCQEADRAIRKIRAK